MNAHAAFLLLIIALAVLLFCRPREQEMRIDMKPAAACEPIDYRTPGYRHPWEPIIDRNKDPRSFA